LVKVVVRSERYLSIALNLHVEDALVAKRDLGVDGLFYRREPLPSQRQN